VTTTSPFPSTAVVDEWSVLDLMLADGRIADWFLDKGHKCFYCDAAGLETLAQAARILPFDLEEARAAITSLIAQAIKEKGAAPAEAR
jgi:hypothetical protein